MKLETGDNIHESGGSDFEKLEREFVTLSVYNNFQPDMPKEVTLHNCLIDGENALMFRKEENSKYKDKMLLFIDCFEDDGTVGHYILRENWGKPDVNDKSASGSPAGTELRKILLVDPNETAHPKIKKEFLCRPFWIKKFVVKGAGSSYHMINVGFEEDATIPDGWQPFLARLDGLYWGDIKENPFEWLENRRREFDEARGASGDTQGQTGQAQGESKAPEQPPVRQQSEPMNQTEADAHAYAAVMVNESKPITAIASELAATFKISTGDAMKIAADEYKKAGQ